MQRGSALPASGAVGGSCSQMCSDDPQLLMVIRIIIDCPPRINTDCVVKCDDHGKLQSTSEYGILTEYPFHVPNYFYTIVSPAARVQEPALARRLGGRDQESQRFSKRVTNLAIKLAHPERTTPGLPRGAAQPSRTARMGMRD